MVERLPPVTEGQRSQGGAPLLLNEPVWPNPEEKYWYDEVHSTLVVEDASGELRRYPCTYATGADAPR